MSVRIVRLVNSEEIIGQVEEKKNSVTIKNGAIIVPAGEGRMALVPWLPHSSQESVEILKDKVLYTFEPLTELANQYSSIMGNGLVTAPAMSIPNAPDFSGLRLSDD